MFDSALGYNLLTIDCTVLLVHSPLLSHTVLRSYWTISGYLQSCLGQLLFTVVNGCAIRICDCVSNEF